MKFSEIIEHVIVLAQRARKESEAEIQRAVRKYRESQSGENTNRICAVPLSIYESLPPSEASNELQAFLMPLKAAEVYMLITIMYLGHDTRSVAGILDFDQQMSNTFSCPEYAIKQMLGKSTLHADLKAGLDILARASIDVNTLLTTHVDSPLALLNSGEGIELKIGPWRCDKCRQMINQPDEGMLQFLRRYEGDRRLGRDLQIVHRVSASPRGGRDGCRANEKAEYAVDRSSVCEDHLHHLLGPDGLVTLLFMTEGAEFTTIDINRIIMRLFVPGYEQARGHFKKAVELGVVEDGFECDYFMQSDLQKIIANIPKMAQL